ncbi:MAG: alpha-amylase [Clostridia bacterium]|nr:alpha-amylase [Clostridia bacterium]
MTVLEQAMQIRAAMDTASATLSDEQAAECAAMFPWWEATAHYKAGDRVRYGELLYKCLTEHDAQESWTPDAAPSLWVRIDDPAEEWPEWVQPTGATDAYAAGAKVSHNGSHWISDVDANTWEPGVYGWTGVVQ